jgi:hypothetical protein
MLRGRFGVENLSNSQRILVEFLAIEKRPQSDKANEGEQKKSHSRMDQE